MVTFNAITMVGTFPIDIRHDDTVFSVKRRIGLATGYATDDIRLYNRSRDIFIEGDDRSFSAVAQEMNIQDGTPIHVIPILRSKPVKKRGSDHDEPVSKSRRLKMKAKNSKKSAKNSKKSIRKTKKSMKNVRK